MGRPAVATTAERLAKFAAETGAITHKEPGALALAARTAIAAAPTVGAATAAAIGAKKLIEGGSAMTQVEKAQEERRKRKQQGQEP